MDSDFFFGGGILQKAKPSANLAHFPSLSFLEVPNENVLW